jgi:hypothetical protein
MTASPSPFPKLSQVWRAARLAGATFASAALVGFAHQLTWPSKTAVIAAAVSAGEVVYRKYLPSGKASGWLAVVVAGVKQAQKTLTPVAAPAVAAVPAAAPVEPAPPAV